MSSSWWPTGEEFRRWLHDPSLGTFDQHLVAHTLGGVVVLLFGRGMFGFTGLKAIVFVAFLQAAWEDMQVENWRPAPGGPSSYPYYSAWLDALTATVAAALCQLLMGLLP